MINTRLLFQLKSHCIFLVHKWKTTKHCEMRKSSLESQQITRAPRRPGNTLEARECCFGIKDTFQGPKELWGGNLWFSRIFSQSSQDEKPQVDELFCFKGGSWKVNAFVVRLQISKEICRLARPIARWPRSRFSWFISWGTAECPVLYLAGWHGRASGSIVQNGFTQRLTFRAKLLLEEVSRFNMEDTEPSQHLSEFICMVTSHESGHSIFVNICAISTKTYKETIIIMWFPEGQAPSELTRERAVSFIFLSLQDNS